MSKKVLRARQYFLVLMRLAQSSRIKETYLFGFTRPTRGKCTGVKGNIRKVVQP